MRSARPGRSHKTQREAVSALGSPQIQMHGHFTTDRTLVARQRQPVPWCAAMDPVILSGSEDGDDDTKDVHARDSGVGVTRSPSGAALATPAAATFARRAPVVADATNSGTGGCGRSSVSGAGSGSGTSAARSQASSRTIRLPVRRASGIAAASPGGALLSTPGSAAGPGRGLLGVGGAGSGGSLLGAPGRVLPSYGSPAAVPLMHARAAPVNKLSMSLDDIVAHGRPSGAPRAAAARGQYAQAVRRGSIVRRGGAVRHGRRDTSSSYVRASVAHTALHTRACNQAHSLHTVCCTAHGHTQVQLRGCRHTVRLACLCGA